MASQHAAATSRPTAKSIVSRLAKFSRKVPHKPAKATAAALRLPRLTPSLRQPSSSPAVIVAEAPAPPSTRSNRSPRSLRSTFTRHRRHPAPQPSAQEEPPPPPPGEAPHPERTGHQPARTALPRRQTAHRPRRRARTARHLSRGKLGITAAYLSAIGSLHSVLERSCHTTAGHV